MTEEYLENYKQELMKNPDYVKLQQTRKYLENVQQERITNNEISKSSFFQFMDQQGYDHSNLTTRRSQKLNSNHSRLFNEIEHCVNMTLNRKQV